MVENHSPVKGIIQNFTIWIPPVGSLEQEWLNAPCIWCSPFHPFKYNHGSTSVKPLMLTATKTSQTFLMKSCRQKQMQENIWWRNFIQDIINNSPSNILWNYIQFKSYHQKYHRSRRKLLEELLSINGLSSPLIYNVPYTEEVLKVSNGRSCWGFYDRVIGLNWPKKKSWISS